MIPSLTRAGWTLSKYCQRIKFPLYNRFKDTITHVYRWLKYDLHSPFVDEEEYWEKTYAESGTKRPRK